MAWQTSSPTLSDEVGAGLAAIQGNWPALEATIGATELAAGTKIIPSGTKFWIYADTAPTNWTIDATPSDQLLAIKGGATYTTGGDEAGDWTITAHTLAQNNIPQHTHTVAIGQTYTSSQEANTYPKNGRNAATQSTRTFTSGNNSGSTSPVTDVDHDATWRPDARVGIICSKD